MKKPILVKYSKIQVIDGKSPFIVHTIWLINNWASHPVA